jgi:hypothetical protein
MNTYADLTDEYIRNYFSPSNRCDMHKEASDDKILELEGVQIIESYETHVRIILPDGKFFCFVTNPWDSFEPQERMSLLRRLKQYTVYRYNEREAGDRL